MLQPLYEAPLPRTQAHLYPIGIQVYPFDIYSRHASRAVCKSPLLTHDSQVNLCTSMTSVYSLAPIIFGADSLD